MQLFSGIETLKLRTYFRCLDNANRTEELFMTSRALCDLDPLQRLLVRSFSHAPRPWYWSASARSSADQGHCVWVFLTAL